MEEVRTGACWDGWQEGHTMLREALENGTRNHNEGPNHDGPSSTEALVKPRRKGHTKDGAELVAGVDESKQTRLNCIFTLLIDAATTEV